mgnify:FL=1
MIMSILLKKGDIIMESKLGLQEVFLNEARKQKTPVTVFMTNGFQQRGVVAAFDGYTLLLHHEGKQYFIYKHAVSTVVPQRNVVLPQE